jgi:hypothetical protein
MQAMKKMLNILLPGALALAFVAAPAVVPTVAAQDTTAAAAASACNPEEQAALDKKFRDNRTTNRDVAYQAAKDYLAKCSSDAGAAAFVKYLNDWVAKQDVINKETADAEKAQRIAKLCADPIQAAGKAQTPADKAKFGSDIFAGCQQFASQMPNNAYPVLVPIDYGFVMATSNPPVNNYNDQTITLAKQAIQKIESNSLGDVKWADYQYKSKDDALAWMNYIIGTITFYNLSGKEADAVPYFYKSLQYDSPDIKKKFQPYYALGFNYRTQYNKAVQDFQAKYANVTDPTEEFKRDLGIQKALMDRAIDAFARAYKAAADAKVSAAVLETRKKDLEQMYKIRFKDQPLNINEVVASTASKPLPDPMSPVTPVIEETPTTTTGATTGSTAAVTQATETKSAAASTGNGNGTRERTAGAAPNTTTAKPDAAKPAAKPATTPKKPSR